MKNAPITTMLKAQYSIKINEEQINEEIEKMENEFLEFFLRIQEDSNEYQIVFLSERIKKIYEILLEKHPEIKINLENNHEKIEYVNDIMAEIPNKLKRKEKVIVFYHDYGLKDKYCFTPHLPEQSIPLPQTYSIREVKKIEKKTKWFKYTTFVNVLYLLANEIAFFQKNYVKNSIELAPTFVKDYFEFYARNTQSMYFFIKLCHIIQMELSGFDDPFIDYEVILALTKTITSYKLRKSMSEEFYEWLVKYKKGIYRLSHTPIRPDQDIPTLELKKERQLK